MVNTKCEVCGEIAPYGTKLNCDRERKQWECPKCAHWSHNEVEIMSANTKEIHPLLNPDSPHYKMVDDVEAIERMEQMYSTEELMIWAKITSMKYRLRIGNKDDVLKEARKLLGYEAYYKYLDGKKK